MSREEKIKQLEAIDGLNNKDWNKLSDSMVEWSNFCFILLNANFNAELPDPPIEYVGFN